MNYLNELCEICGHLGVDHEDRNTFIVSVELLKSICWKCSSDLLERDVEIININSYHKFKLDNLNYLQKLYEEKKKVK